MKPVSIPGGLEDHGVEIYIHNDQLRAIHRGQIVDFNDLPEDVKDNFVQHLFSNTMAVRSLHKDFGITDAGEMLTQYVKCNFGNFDSIPDMDEEGRIQPKCWDCGQRGCCPGEGRVCSRIMGPNGLLSKRETEVFFRLIAGQNHKMIADFYGTSQATVETQVKAIREKLGCNSSIEIMNFAMQRKLINL